ncbi:MAG: isochorismatase family protein [Chitinophagaceae bacterium]
MNRALIIVDVQRDFCPGGALAAPMGNEIIPVINKLMDKFEIILASKDWHPSKTVHFDKWPPHCIRGTEGAAFHPGLQQSKIEMVALKGTGNSDDGYSAFEATNMDLSHWLKRKNVDAVYTCGIATEYCVMSTAKDAVKAGFKTYCITDAIAPVNVHKGDGEEALQKMNKEGISLITSDKILMK